MSRVLAQPALTVIAGPTGAGKDRAVGRAGRAARCGDRQRRFAGGVPALRPRDGEAGRPASSRECRTIWSRWWSRPSPFSAARWGSLADAAIAEVAARGRPVPRGRRNRAVPPGVCSTGSPTPRRIPRSVASWRTRRAVSGRRRCTGASGSRPPDRGSPRARRRVRVVRALEIPRHDRHASFPAGGPLTASERHATRPASTSSTRRGRSWSSASPRGPGGCSSEAW
jgi:hypothetical protein